MNGLSPTRRKRVPTTKGAATSLSKRLAWFDVSAGVAGDMLLGALVDVGARLDVIQRAVDHVIPGAVKLRVRPVTRAGLRATKLDVEAEQDASPRNWAEIRALLKNADLGAEVRSTALSVFARLAEAESRVHGISADDVHFHEVGALDSIADIVGCCAALADLGVEEVVASDFAVGSGRVHTQHGELPVPVPAVLELSRGWRVTSGGPGELATPTGVALVTTFALANGPMPGMQAEQIGVGAGERDTLGRPNVVRVVIGTSVGGSDFPTSSVLIEANVDDLDPRAWPGTLTALLEAGATDAWLTPILMKKGRPAHTLHVLGRPDLSAKLRNVMFAQTTTIGARETVVNERALPRDLVSVRLPGGIVRVMVAHRDGVAVRINPDFDDASAMAVRLGIPVHDVLAEAAAMVLTSESDLGAAIPTE